MVGKSTVVGGEAADANVREPDVVLYSTSACHLCEQAEALLLPRVGEGLVVAVEDISESDALFEKYGVSIPVLRRVDSGAELYWPFDARDIDAFLA